LRNEKKIIRKEYLKRLYRSKGYFPYQDANGTFQARIKDVHETGLLILETVEGETRMFTFKEVSFVI